jgi:cytoskeleton protein RodZ
MSETPANPDDLTAPAAADGTREAAAVPVALARSIGERLRAGRERSGLSIAAAAEKLHLDPKVIDALEADRFAEVGASVYVRGHLRRYADFVGEAGGELVAMYSTREMPAAKPDLRQVPQAERRADPRRLLTPLMALGAGGVLLGAIWWVLAGSGVPSAPAPAKPATPVVSGDATPVATVSFPATTVSLNASAPATPLTQTPPPASAPATRAADATVAPVKEAPAREVRLQLELAGDSWVEVYDSRGERLYYDVASAGSVQSVAGPAPLRVVLGNSAGVTVAVDGQSREIPASAIDGEGARFVVNRSGTLSRAR